MIVEPRPTDGGLGATGVRQEGHIVDVENVARESGLVLNGELVDLGLGHSDVGQWDGVHIPLPRHRLRAVLESCRFRKR